MVTKQQHAIPFFLSHCSDGHQHLPNVSFAVRGGLLHTSLTFGPNTSAGFGRTYQVRVHDLRCLSGVSILLCSRDNGFRAPTANLTTQTHITSAATLNICWPFEFDHEHRSPVRATLEHAYQAMDPEASDF